MTGRVPSDMPPVAPALVVAVNCSSRDQVVCILGTSQARGLGRAISRTLIGLGKEPGERCSLGFQMAFCVVESAFCS